MVFVCLFVFLFGLGLGSVGALTLLTWFFLASVVNRLILEMVGNLSGCFWLSFLKLGVMLKGFLFLVLFFDFYFSTCLSFMEVCTRVACSFMF